MLIVQLIIVQVVTFALLVFVLRKILYSASFAEVRRLQDLNKENSNKSQELAEKIEEAQIQRRENIVKAEEEARKLKAQAKEEAERVRAEILEKARVESERIVSLAHQSKGKIRQELEEQFDVKSLERALKLIEEVLSQASFKKVHESCLEETIGEIEKLPGGGFRTAATTGELSAPYELSKEKREKIEALLSQKAGRKITLEQKADKGVVAGVVIKLGSLVIDGSLAGRLREAAEAVQK